MLVAENIRVTSWRGFDTRITGLFEMIDNFVEQHGCAEVLDFNWKLFHLNTYAAETGFKTGGLAGAIFAEPRIVRSTALSATGCFL